MVSDSNMPLGVNASVSSECRSSGCRWGCRRRSIVVIVSNVHCLDEGSGGSNLLTKNC